MRRADQTDISELLKVGAALAAEAKPPMPFDATTRRQWLSAILQRPDVLCLIESDDLGITGLIMGEVQSVDGQGEANVEYIWAHPDYRSSRLCLYMMKVFEDWARDKGAKVLWFASSTGHSLETFARLVGAEEAGRTYRKALTNGSARPS